MESTLKKEADTGFFTPADNVILRELFQDVRNVRGTGNQEEVSLDEQRESLNVLSNINDEKHPDFQPTIFATWDYNLKDIKVANDIRTLVLRQYVTWARTVVRRQTDVVFLTHIILYFLTSVPSAIYLFYSFNYLHGIAHLLMTVWYSGSFTLMLHNHIHNNGVLSKSWSTFDYVFPYILEPLMGHTWDSYYYHHVKHHHVEGNGPEDLSTTIRYQRDSVWAFLHYELRFFFLCWFDLPLYFFKKGKYYNGLRVLTSELASYSLMVALARWKLAPTMFTLILPFTILRIGLMIGNWGQHALVDDVEPSSDFRSSITLIDVPVRLAVINFHSTHANPCQKSNRFCFNDGYHTSHHLNPLRHWRDHPNAFLQAKGRYSSEGALVFQNIDYLEVTYRLLTKNYMKLADQLVPIGEQIHMSKEELAEMLRRKTRKFSEKEIREKFGAK